MSLRTSWTTVTGEKALTGIVLGAGVLVLAGALLLAEPTWQPPRRALLFHSVFLLGLPAVVAVSAIVLLQVDPPEAVGLWASVGYVCMLLLTAGITAGSLGLTQTAGDAASAGEIILRNTNVGGLFGFLGGVSYGQILHTRQIQEQLERRNTQLEVFAGVVAHDLRNPLNVANLRVELAMDECNSEHLEDASGALDRMDSLINDLFTLSQQGEPVGAMESIELADLVELCWTSVETGDATLVTNTDLVIRADQSRLQQLLENFVRNAVEHAGTETTITVGDLHDGFYIADDGPGVPENEWEEIFELGYSGDANGTGFGLAIVSEVAQAHGWEVSVTESESGGAQFEITGVEIVE